MDVHARSFVGPAGAFGVRVPALLPAGVDEPGRDESVFWRLARGRDCFLRSRLIVSAYRKAKGINLSIQGVEANENEW